MKRILSLAMLTLAIFTASAAEFDFDQQELNAEFSELDALENLIIEQNLTAREVLEVNPKLMENVSLNAAASISQTNEKMPILGPFWWGCCLSVIGLLLVYVITDNDKAQMKNALIGCIVGTLFFGLGGFLDPFSWF